ncbi:MAG: DUF3417 domain-containing protein, partial [Acidimicrobiia bacterium]
IGPEFTASRMVRDYVTELYEPAAKQADHALAPGLSVPRELAAWKQRVRQGWSGVNVVSVDAELAPTRLGTVRQVTAKVTIDGLAPEDVTVQLIHGQVGPTDELNQSITIEMEHAGVEGNTHLYRSSFAAGATGRYGFNVRVLPCHDGLASPLELGLISWAK